VWWDPDGLGYQKGRRRRGHVAKIDRVEEAQECDSVEQKQFREIWRAP